MTDTPAAPVPNEPAGPTMSGRVRVRVLYDSTEVYIFELDTTGLDPADYAVTAAEAAFERLNTDHPPRWPHRSMSVGDVVIVGETALRCAPIGWEPVPADKPAGVPGSEPASG